MFDKIVLLLGLVSLIGICTACTSHRPTPILFGHKSNTIKIKGLSTCSQTEPDSILLNPNLPLTVLVHGCNSSGGRFRALAEVFEAHGQQTVCFNYNDRESLQKTAAQLRTSLHLLKTNHQHPSITVLGHSQGGLIARRALVTQHNQKSVKNTVSPQYRLITISSPFNGINASSHCGIVPLHIATLGATVGICVAVAGSKWNEIHDNSKFMRQPGKLVENVVYYLKVVTDEINTCRRHNKDGSCAEDDFVFHVNEQYNPKIDIDSRVENIEVQSGHAEIVGKENVPPKKLVKLLQDKNILSKTPIEKRKEIARLFDRLY